jgi:hypothetical protein
MIFNQSVAACQWKGCFLQGSVKVILHIMGDQKLLLAKPQSRKVFLIFLGVFASWRENLKIST